MSQGDTEATEPGQRLTKVQEKGCKYKPAGVGEAQHKTRLLPALTAH